MAANLLFLTALHLFLYSSVWGQVGWGDFYLGKQTLKSFTLQKRKAEIFIELILRAKITLHHTIRAVVLTGVLSLKKIH